MDRSLRPPEWKPQETTGNHRQGEMPFLAGVQPPLLLAAPLLSAASFSGCLNEAVRNSGMADQEIAERIHISHGYMSKFMRGVAQQWAKRLIAFMRVTNSLTPLQWMAHQMGCRLVMEDETARELAQARARVAELERMERMAA
jgi:transcriptional regulator with XRE-family HTH domain